MFEFGIIGIFTGFFSGFFGIGGGTILVPTLLYFHLSIKTAIGISVTQMMFSSLFGSFLNYKKGLLKIDEGVFLGIGGAIGASLSGIIVSIVNDKFLSYLFLFILFLSILKFFYSPDKKNKEEINDKLILFFIGFFVGMIAISVGVGGAVMITPILVGLLNYDLKKAVSLSLFFVVFSSTSGFISLSFNNLIDYQKAILVAIFSLIGTFIGIKLYHKINSKSHKKQLLLWYIFIFILTSIKIIGD